MREILDFFKDIFMIKEETNTSIGLSQFKVKPPKTSQPMQVKQKKNKELNLSDLMRQSLN